MATRPDKPLSADEFCALPECNITYELVRGHLVAEPPPRAQHGRVAAQIAHVLQLYVRQGGRPGVVLTCDTWFELSRSPATVRGPDVAYLPLERYRQLDERCASVEGAPDLAVEVRSPSQSHKAMCEKADDYLAAGATEVWVVDADAVSLCVYRPGELVTELRNENILTSPELLPGFSVRVRELIDLAL